MTALPAARRYLTLAAALLAAGALLVAPEASAVEPVDPAVAQAKERVGAARDELGQLTAQLDDIAAAYEHARAHSQRLEDELAGADSTVAAVQAEVEAADAAFSRRVTDAYMYPGGVAGLADAVLVAPDAATALHRAALLGRLAARSADAVDDAEALATVTTDAVRQHRIVQAGAYAAAEERQRLADELSLAVGNAQHRLRSAEQQLADEQRAAARRAEERERAARAAADAARAAADAARITAGAAPPVMVDGKVCPIGAPNGFIDSWGFPRSGGRTHKGVDMFAAYGTPLYAVTDGVVRVTTNRLGGLSVHLAASNGDRYYYAHLSAVAVASGQQIRSGDVVGANGDSGNARGTPPHLHWEYHPRGGGAVNPYPLAAALCR